MKTSLRALLILFLLIVLPASFPGEIFAQEDPVRHDWENPSVFNINKEKPHAHFIPFRTVEEALNLDKKASVFYKSLNGN
ncbi:MAG: hypothetical protein RQ743_13365, partial [Bacteroidales bacterium]|nr:hypothetical protein [Bacteroidales bacterium]